MGDVNEVIHIYKNTIGSQILTWAYIITRFNDPIKALICFYFKHIQIMPLRESFVLWLHFLFDMHCMHFINEHDYNYQWTNVEPKISSEISHHSGHFVCVFCPARPRSFQFIPYVFARSSDSSVHLRRSPLIVAHNKFHSMTEQMSSNRIIHEHCSLKLIIDHRILAFILISILILAQNKNNSSEWNVNWLSIHIHTYT